MNIFFDDEDGHESQDDELFSAEVARIPLESPPTKKMNLRNDKDAKAMLDEARRKAITSLYNSDTLVRDSLLAQVSLERAEAAKKSSETVAITSDQGHVVGLSKPVLTGVHATTKNQVDLIRAITASVRKNYSVD